MEPLIDSEGTLVDAPKILRISQFPVQSMRAERLAQRLFDGLEQHRQQVLFFANTNFIVQCRHLIEQLDDPSLILVNDGVGLSIAARLMLGQRFEANLNGTDFTPFLFRQAPRPLKLFMIGGKPEALAKAVVHVREAFGQEVVGSCDGYAGMRDGPGLIARVNAAKADLLLVAMGNPLQENWILAHRQALEVPLLMGVGALFDFWAGDKRRAPQLVRRLRLEWLYRLSLEPRRLMRRYTLDIVLFLRDCFVYR